MLYWLLKQPTQSDNRRFFHYAVVCVMITIIYLRHDLLAMLLARFRPEKRLAQERSSMIQDGSLKIETGPDPN